MKVSDLMYCYGAGVVYHIYQKPYMTKLIDCGVTTFDALLNQPTMLDALTLVGTVITNITGQPVLLFFLAASLIPVGIRIFRSLKRAAK